MTRILPAVLKIQSSIPGRHKRFFSSPQIPDRLWSLPSLLYNGHKDSSVGIKTGYGPEGRGLIPRIGKRLLSALQAGIGAHPASYPMVTRDTFLLGKLAGV
jgi:hypothetical protein